MDSFTELAFLPEDICHTCDNQMIDKLFRINFCLHFPNENKDLNEVFGVIKQCKNYIKKGEENGTTKNSK